MLGPGVAEQRRGEDPIAALPCRASGADALARGLLVHLGEAPGEDRLVDDTAKIGACGRPLAFSDLGANRLNQRQNHPRHCLPRSPPRPAAAAEPTAPYAWALTAEHLPKLGGWCRRQTAAGRERFS
jgi:hypothetical protein